MTLPPARPVPCPHAACNMQHRPAANSREAYDDEALHVHLCHRLPRSLRNKWAVGLHRRPPYATNVPGQRFKI